MDDRYSNLRNEKYHRNPFPVKKIEEFEDSFFVMMRSRLIAKAFFILAIVRRFTRDHNRNVQCSFPIKR